MIFLSVNTKNQRAAAINNLLSGGFIRVYGGDMPLGGGAITDQTLLSEISLPTPAGSVADGVFTLGDVASGFALATGIATWARFLDSVDGVVMDVEVGAELSITPQQVYAGGVIRIDTFQTIES